MTSAPVSNNKGQVFEQMACRYLQQQGLELVESNYRSRKGEIDLIMLDDHCLVFVEVRYRATNRYGSGAETVNRRKQERLIATANHYLQGKHHGATQAARFDVISIGPQQGTDQGTDSMLWIKNAFQA